MEVAPPIKYRRRKVSAVRDYPKGCGPSAAPKKPAVMLSNGSSPPEEKPPEVAASSDKLVPTPTPESAEPVGNNTKPVDDAPEAPAAAVEDGKGAAAIDTKPVADGPEAPAVAAAIATKPVGDAPEVPAVVEDVKEVGVNDTKPVGDAPEVPPVGVAPAPPVGVAPEAPPVGDSPEAPATEDEDGKGVVANDTNPNPVDDAREAPAEAAVENVKGAATNDTSPFGDAPEAPAAAAAEEEEDGKGSALKLDAPQEKLEVAPPHQPEPSGTSVVVEVAEELCYSRIYPPPKRRKLSAIREFPANCGPKAPRSSNLKVASAKADILDGEKTPSASQKKAEVEVENDEPKLNSNPPAIQQPKVDKSASETEVEKDDPVKDAGDTLKRKRSDEEKKPMAKKPPASEDSIKVTSSGKPQGDSLKRKRTDEEKQPIMKKPPASEGSVKVKSTEKPHGEAKRNDTKLIRAGLHEMSNEAREVKRNVAKQMQKISQEVSGESQEAKRSGTKKIRDKAQEDTKQISERALEVRDGARDVKMSDTKQVREKTQEVSGEAQVKSSPKSSLSERTAEDRNEKKVLVEATPEKKTEGRDTKQKSSLSERTTEDRNEKKILVEATPEKKTEGRDTKQLSKSLPVKQAHDSRLDLDARSESGSKSIVKVGGSSAGKLVKKESAKHQSDSKILKRKPPADEGSKALIIANVQTGEDLDLEACRKKVIVQALMAAPNCPWRQGRKSGGAGSRSVTPKSRIKKERKPLSALKGSSSSQLTSEVFDESVEDSVLHSEGDEKALVLYEPPRELSITLPPLAPPKSDYNGGDEELSDRYRVKRALRLFQFITRKLLQGDETKTMPLGRMRVDLKAAGILKEKNEYVNSGKPIIGHVPGVEVGDEFRFRVELSIIGIHRPFQGGIDYTKVNGIHLATSIVASGGYPDDVGSSDVLIYSGSGGNPTGGDKQAEDQKLERGNLALKNSIDAKTPVRVVHGFKEAKGSEHDPKGKPTSTFTYDGLYVVEKYWSEPGPRGFSVYKFQLRRMAGQPELSLKEVKKSKKSKVREGLCMKDISDGKERIPICAVNTIDDDKPMPFRYTTANIYPSWYVHTSPRGCDCTDGCSDSEKCACAGKNGGEIPFNYNGAIVQAKPLVYECGPSCKCPRSCHNRVSQHGIKIPLEIFKTESRGWGVRSLYSIPSGSFICEYIGELLKDSEAEQRSNDEYLFDIGHNYEDKNLWEGLPSLIPELQPSSSCETVDDVGFTIDAADYGNIGRFINHSCSPNIYAQNVLYDHDDKRMPHIMFFAADNIPPLQELTYHYNYTIDQVRDSEGNIKTKNCYCGAPECSGRLY